MRRSRMLGVALVAGALVVVLLVLSGGEDTPTSAAESSVPGLSTRGPDSGDDELVERALEAWASDTDVDEGEAEPPGMDVELLWAGPRGTEGNDAETKLVAFYDPSTVKFAVVRFLDSDSDGDLAQYNDFDFPSSEVPPPLVLEEGVTLVPDNLPPQTKLVAGEDVDGDDADPPEVLDGAVLNPSGVPYVFLPSASAAGSDSAAAVPLVFSGGATIVEGANWQEMRATLANPGFIEPAIAALRGLDDSEGEPGLEEFYSSKVLWAGSPAPGWKGVALAGADPAPRAATFGYARGGEAGVADLRDPPILGEVPPFDVIAADWVFAEGDTKPWFVAFGDEDVKRLHINIGSEELMIEGSGAVLEGADLPEVKSPEELPNVSVAGFTADGEVVPAN